MIELTSALVALYRDRLRRLRTDTDERSWGGLSREAAFDVLGDGATPEAVDALLDGTGDHL